LIWRTTSKFFPEMTIFAIILTQIYYFVVNMYYNIGNEIIFKNK